MSMKTYKGTDKNMQCKGYRYELGKTAESDGATRCGDKGFHSCKAPFDVLRYYRPANGSRYFEAEADGKVDFGNGETDTKLASSKLTLTKEIDFPALVKAQIKYTQENAESGTSGGDYSNLAGGYQSNLAGGDYSNLAGGDRSNLAGGESSIMVGRNGCKAKGGKHSVLVLTKWGYSEEGKFAPVCVKAEIVDGERVKADTWYALVDGEFKEVTE